MMIMMIMMIPIPMTPVEIVTDVSALHPSKVQPPSEDRVSINKFGTI